MRKSPKCTAICPNPSHTIDRELSETELEHLRLLRLGLSVREAAKYVYRDPRTVANHRAAIRRKIGEQAYEEARYEGERVREGIMLRCAAVA